MRIVALSEKSGWHTAIGRGHALTCCSWLAVSGRVATKGAAVHADNVQLDTADAIIVRTMPPGTLEQVVFRMDALHRLASAGGLVVNNPRAIETAVDKYLALTRIEAAGLPVPPTIVCQRLVDATRAFDELGGDVVIKPIFGSQGWGMTRISDRDLAARAFAQLERMGAAIYVQKWIDHGGSDLRIFVIAGTAVAGMRRTAADWRTNAARGAATDAIVVDGDMGRMAGAAAAACGAEVAGVDIMHGPAGEPYVIEVNAAPGWQALVGATRVDVAGAIVDHLAARRAVMEAANVGR